MTRITPRAGALRSTAASASLILFALIVAVACDSAPERGDIAPANSRPQVRDADDPESEANYTPVEVDDGGTIRGTVRFTGEVPAPRDVPVTVDREICGESRQVRQIVTGPGGTVADVVVSIVDIRRGAALAPESFPSLDQRECRFRPHVLVAPVGAAVRVLNSDPLTHNVHTVAFDNRPVNRTQPADLDVIELRFDAPEKVRVKCDLHPWMNAWIVVAQHPYHAVTDTTGSFELRDVPAGTHTLEFWHESMGSRSRTVTLEAGEEIELTIDVDGPVEG